MVLAGQQLGYYRLIRLIGQGGMGEVYLGEDTRISRQVAIKVVRTERQPYLDAEASQQVEKFFEREMKAISLLDHPYILSFYDFGKLPTANGSIIYMVMPYRPEGSLADWLIPYGSDLLSPQDVGHIIAQAASALQHAHDHNVIHRDVKPSNFLVHVNTDHPTRPDLFLVDFGLARVISATSLGSSTVRGTYSCMAPEQWSGEAYPASDQYALAIMSYLLLTGQLPFHGPLEHVMYQHLTVQPKPPSELNSRLSSAIDDVILRALAKKSNARFPTIKAFAFALQQAIDYTDLHVTLTINKAKALQGGSQTVTLPGKLQVTMTVKIPPNAQDRQMLRLLDQGTPYYGGGPRGPLLLHLHIDQDEAMPNFADADKNDLSSVPASRDFTKQSPSIVDSNVHLPSINEPISVSLAALAPPPSEAMQPSNNTALVPVSSETAGPIDSTNNRSKSLKWQRIILLVTLALLLIVSGVLAVVLVDRTIVASNNRAIGTAQSIAYNDAAGTAKAMAAVQITDSTATAIAANPELDPYQPLGTLSQSQVWKELSNPTSGSQCQFINGMYQISQSQPNKHFICNEDTQYTNFAFEVKMTIHQGNCGGLTIRGNSDSSQLYFFRVCQDGFYTFAKYVSSSASDAVMLKSGNSLAVKRGTGQLNVIAVVANGSGFDLYINRQKIDSATDSSYSQGSIGLIADAPDSATTITYQDARVWTIG